ncbi:MAG: Polysulfide reductase-like molybdopterin-binding protein subunit [Ignavibacteria bacterium]|nr:Polysulfide reductase-like molybdopterin-binding protein subunit [Ignavibacteria bacterium]
MNSLSRRKFLQISGSTFAAASAIGALGYAAKGSLALAEEKKESGIKKIPTYCNLCFWKCGAIAWLKDGQLWKITGNPLDPLSNGRLCPRGTGGIGTNTDPNRLKAPLIRTKKRGEDAWSVVTWDEALNYIAGKLNKIKSELGPESVALFSHGIGGNFIKHTFLAYGTPHIFAPSYAQCRGPRDVGFELTFGEGIGSPERTDIKNTRCMALIGSHLGENMHNSQVQELSVAVDNGASIIVVDPRFSIVAGKAKYYLPIKPGTDMALLLAWANVIIKEKKYDVEFVELYGLGFEQFAASVAQYTPEWAYTETGIEPQLIIETALELARNKPASFIHPGRHTTWYGDDTQRSRTIALVNALLGNWNHKGAFFKPVKLKVPSYPYPDYPESTRGRADNPGKKYPWAGEDEGLTNGIREATITGKPYPIKAWVTYSTNLINALPNQQETIKAIQNLDLMVAIDILPSEIAGWADVVLPEATYLERFDDLHSSPFTTPFLGIRQPAVKPPEDQKPGWWIAKKLADKLGLGQYFPWKDIEEYLKYRVESAGLSYDELKENGIILGEKLPNYVEEGLEQSFPTPSGKVEFYSPQLEEKGFPPIPVYTKHENPHDGYFRLLFGRTPVHTFSFTQSNPILQEMFEENEVWINADIAKSYNLKSGDYIKLKNQDGVVSNKLKVRATERIRTDCVYMVHGFGHQSKALKTTYNKGANDAQLVTKYKIDPIMGGTGMNVNFVTFIQEGV